MPALRDLSGKKFGRLTVIKYVKTDRFEPNGRRICKWKCQCDCGSASYVSASNLRSGSTMSCGCLRQEVTSANRKKHGFSNGRVAEYILWKAMISRCTSPRHASYKNYGGRGIKVCEKWKNDFVSFLIDVGQRPEKTLTIERINNDGDYDPGNVGWATRKEQRHNQRSRVRTDVHCAHGHLLSVVGQDSRGRCKMCLRDREARYLKKRNRRQTL